MLKDDPDSRILECAVTAHLDLILTGDQAMLGLAALKESGSYYCEHIWNRKKRASDVRICEINQGRAGPRQGPLLENQL
jgi:predicted nucleic acid-binding protein